MGCTLGCSVAAMITAAASTAGELPEGGIINLDAQLLVDIAVNVVNLLAIVAVLTFVLYKPVKKFMAAREARIKTDLENAAQEEKLAVQLRQQYEEKLANIEEERNELMKKDRAASMARGDEIISEARREAASIYRQSMEALRMEQQNQREDVRSAIVEISSKMAARFVELSIDEKTRQEYVEAAMRSLEESPWEE